jgi:hypothetical protein
MTTIFPRDQEQTERVSRPAPESTRFVYRPRDVVKQYPALAEPARELGLLEDEVFDAGMPSHGVPVLIAGYFPGCKIEARARAEATRHSNVIAFEAASAAATGNMTAISGGQVPTSWLSFAQEVPHICLEEHDGRVNGVDLLREVGAMVEWQTARLLSMTKGSASIEIAAGGTTLVFKRENTPGVYLQKAGLIVRDSGYGLPLDRNAAVMQALSFTILLGQDPRYVFLDIFERARVDQQMLSMLTVLATRSGVDWSDRQVLTDYARMHYQLYERAQTHLANMQQVNDHASYFARHIQMHMRRQSV